MQESARRVEAGGLDAGAVAGGAAAARDYTLREALRTRQWWTLWLILFLNVSAGISLISQQAPLFQELAGVSAVAAAGMVGIVSIGNAHRARVLGVAVRRSSAAGSTFVMIFLLQVVLFWILPDLHSAALLTVVAFVILMCYGGGFGTMPAYGGRLLRCEERRTDLRADADRLGLGQRVRSADDGRDARNDRLVRGAAARHRGGHGGIDALAGDAAAAGARSVRAGQVIGESDGMSSGIGQQKPHHYLEMARIAWENRDQLPFAWRILRDGVCDGCALGTSGLSDWTLPGTHLCMVRLELMRLNTAPALDPRFLSDCRSLAVAHRRRSCASSAGCPSRCCAAHGERGFLRRRRGTRRSIASPRELRAVDPGARGLLSDVARHHQRGLLRGPEGGAIPRHATTSTTRRASATRRPPRR